MLVSMCNDQIKALHIYIVSKIYHLLPSMVVHACNPTTWKDEAIKSQIWGRPGQLNENLSPNKKNKRSSGYVVQW